jgi:tetratricopeptide (TPR) repeat protein
MNNSALYSYLHVNFSAEEASSILSALRQDTMVWQSVQEGEWLAMFTGEGVETREDLSPGRLALIALGHGEYLPMLRERVQYLIDDELQKRSSRFLKSVHENDRQITSLEKAGLAALGLREQWRLSQNWKEAFIKAGFFDEESSKPENWRTALACLYGLVPDGMGMLDMLSTLDTDDNYQAVISHVLLANPILDEERQRQLIKLLEKKSLANAVSALRGMAVLGESRLAKQMADVLLDSHLDDCKDAKSDWKTMDSFQLLERIDKLQSLAGLCQLSGQSKKGAFLLKAVEEAGCYWRAGLQLQRLATAEKTGEAEEYIGKVLAASQAELVFGQPEVSFVSKSAVNALEEISLSELHPFLQLRKAQQTHAGGGEEKAKAISQGAVQEIVKMVSRHEALYVPRFVANWNPIELIEILESLNMNVEALQIAHILQQERPNDVQLLHYISKYLENTEDYPSASNYAFAAAIINPDTPENFQRLALLQEKQLLWKDAYESWAQVIRLTEDPQADDWMKFGNSAYQADMPRIAAKACESAIEKEPKNELANSLMGKALQQMEDFEASIPYLIAATKAGPQNAVHWLDLSKSYMELELKDHSISTLQAGHKVVPESAEINFSLGKLYQADGKAEKASPYFEAAAGLNPESSESAYELAANLFALEKYDKAKETLVKSFEKWPKDQSIAWLLAELSLQEGDYLSAVPALEIAIEASEATDELKLAYVEAIFKGQNPLLADDLIVPVEKEQLAEAMLEEMLEAQPRSFVVQLTLAEVMGARGRNQEALQIFRELVETAQVTLPEWRWRLFAGMGAVADSLEKKDIALAAMREAAQAAPDRLDVLKKLTKVYMHADLSEEAFQTVRNVRNIAPDEISVLGWYAEIASLTEHVEDAMEALRCATEIDARSPEMWVRLAALQCQVQDKEAARASLEKLAVLEEVSPQILRKAAHLHVGLQELDSAEICLKKAREGEVSDPALTFDLACVQAQSGEMDAAEKNLQELLGLYPENAYLHMFHADILVSLDRVQGALASLQHAETMADVDRQLPFAAEDVIKVLSKDWHHSLIAPESIDLRMGVLHEMVGDSETALCYLEKALSQNRHSAQIRFMAADLADALLYTEKGAGMLPGIDQLAGLKNEEIELLSVMEKEARAGLFAMDAALSLSKGETASKVEEVIDRGLHFDAEHPGLLALKSRNLVRKGDVGAAEEQYRKALRHYGQMKDMKNQSQNLWQASTNGQDKLPSSVGIQISEAAMFLENWDDAVRVGEDLTEKRPYEGRSLLHQISLIVRLREQEIMAKELRVIRHAPDQKTLGFANEEKFNDLVDRLETIRRCEESVRWAARGNMVFHSSLEAIRSFSKSAKSEEDLGALVAALRRSSNFAGAIQIAKKHSAEAKVLLEYGLSLQNTAPDEAVAAISKAVDMEPQNPLTLAALAMACQEAGEHDEALAALETSLEMWPDEPEWHAWAAQLAGLGFESEKAVEHWKTSVELMPDQIEYKLSLSDAYIQNGEATQAIALLESMKKKTGNQGQVWLLLSKAYQQTEDLGKALQASERAATIDRYSPEPVLQSGRIALRMGKQKKALECARLALKRAPGTAGSLLFLCEVQKSAGKSVDALRMLEEAIKGGQNSAPVMLEHARLVRSMKGAEETEPLLQALVEKEPENAEILSDLAEVQMDLDKPQEASLHAFRALKINPTLKGLNFLIGGMKRADGQLDQAVHYFSEAVRQYPHDLEAYVALGETYTDRRENQQALKIFGQAMEIAPDDFRLYYQAGVILREQKDYMSAEDMMRRASELAPSDINIRRQLGAIVALNLVHNPKGVKA